MAKRGAFKQWLKGLSRRPWMISFLKTLVATYMWLLYATARKTFRIAPETQALLDAKTPLILANWHGRLFLTAPLWRHIGTMPMSVISSSHADGQIVGGGAERLGLIALRGTRGGEGGAKAMRLALKALKGDTSLIINPDGPSGPRQVLGEGTAAIAQLSGAPVVGLTFSCDRGRFLTRQWDQAVIPHFFARITFDLSAPIYAERGQDREAVRQTLESHLNQQLWTLDGEFGHPQILADLS